jgi:starvation-inducible DNA-binding protein
MVGQQEYHRMKGISMQSNRNDGRNSNLPVMIQPNIGLDSEVRHAVVKLLNITLADEAVLAAKIRCAHSNIRGANFYGLHRLFENQSQEINTISNDLAERARILGGFAIGSLVEFLRHTRLEEYPGVVPDVLHLLADYETSIRFLREDARKCTEEYEDEGTFELLVSLMRQHEKMAWMLRSYLEDESLGEKDGGS